MISAMPVILAFLYFLKVEYDQSYKEAKHDVLVAVQSIALEHNAQVEGIRNLLITLSQFPEVQSMDPVACSKILNHILEQSPSSMNIGVADPDGNVIATGVKQPLPISYKVTDRKYFQDAIRTKKFSAGEYTVSRAVGKPTIHFALPILDSAGNPKVVLYAALDLTKFVTLFKAQHLPENSAFSLMDHKGTLLYRYPEISNLKSGLPDAPGLWSRLSGSHEDGVFVDIGRDDLKRVFGFKRLRLSSSDPPHLYIRLSVSDKTVISKTYKLVGIILLISLVALIISYLFSSILARLSFILPIEQLSMTVREVEGGNLSSRSGLTHLDDEIGQLAKSFDAMTESLAEKENARKLAEESLQERNSQLELEIIERKKIEVDLHENAVLLETEIAEHQKSNEALQEKTVELESEIEEREAAQQSLEEQATVLEEEIAERIRIEEEHARLEEQLRQSQKMEAIGLLAGGVAHDFNNILSVIMGYGDLLVNGLPDGKAHDNATHILKASERAAELTKGLLAFSRKQTFNLERTDISQLVAENSSFLQRMIGEDVELVTSCPSIPMCIFVDRSQIQQVLMNLVTNARDAMPSGGKLTISIVSQNLDYEFIKLHGCGIPGKYVVIQVSDTGTGMVKETVERIFEPFFTTKEKDKGTGLGLSMIHGIIAQHNGFIRCSSELGKGTTFYIYLPLCENEELSEASEADSESRFVCGRETILLAEDDSMLMEITTSHLEASGYTVIQACNGVEAVEIFRKQGAEIDLVLLDAIMPKMTGKQAWDEISTLSPGVKACFISGYANEIINGKLAIDFSVPFISKPVMPEVLLKKVRDILDDSGINAR
jgi:two-component system, cell cycle sensor histidine kinase and response regulator CckA